MSAAQSSQDRISLSLPPTRVRDRWRRFVDLMSMCGIIRSFFRQRRPEIRVWPISSATSSEHLVQVDSNSSSRSDYARWPTLERISAMARRSMIRAQVSDRRDFSNKVCDSLVPMSFFSRAFPFFVLCDWGLKVLDVGSGQ